ncbi:MAG: ABC-F family ATP-binding cassette domain-containing protein [Verrucomicrobiales bacterium]|nr:ABC-F family ATP-binding cassette domain-containing protein [Verrucomicrobiales bacterium]
MLTFSGVTKAFGGRTLFSDAALAIVRGDRVGLVGPNGAGKSTLFRILLGEETADEGTVAFARGSRVGILPQESAPAGDETVLDLALGIHHPEPQAGDDEHIHQEGHHHAVDGETIARAKRILSGLAFRESDYDRPAREMSGGWVMRAHLARLLVSEPDLLMLDEPTNHLDLEALIWVQEYLRTYPGALLLISHDREFLNQLCTHIVEVRQARLYKYTGNYNSYLGQREATEQALLATAKSQQRRIDQLQDFVDRFRAKNTKAAQAQSKLKQIERLREEMVEVPGSDGPVVDFQFPQPERSGLRVIRLAGIRFAYGNTPIYDGIDFEAERGRRIVLVGPNGAGKSTLLKLLAGALTPQAGERTLGHNVRAGYFAQYRLDTLNPAHTVLEEAFNTPQRVTETFVRTVLGSFLFRGDDVFKRVSVLSGGEKSRLALVKLLLDPPNLILMDEPTTHLDLASVDALIEALQQYAGTLIFISHDVHFIRSIANHVVHVKSGRLSHYPGGYDYYLDKTRQGARDGLTGAGRSTPGPMPGPSPAQTLSAPAPDGASRKEQKRLEAQARQEKAKQRKDLQQRVSDLEKAIAKLEAREKELVIDLERPETYNTPGRAMVVNRDLMDVHDRLAQAHKDWERAAEELQAME